MYVHAIVVIPLNQVSEEYRSRGQYFTHLKTVGIQFGIFRDVFGRSFHPNTFTTIRYDNKQVYQGNILKASEVNSSVTMYAVLAMPDRFNFKYQLGCQLGSLKNVYTHILALSRHRL